MKDFLKDYMERAGKTLARSDFDCLKAAADILLEARKNGNWIIAAGNGGSGATASHFVNDFAKGLSMEGHIRFKAIALNDCVPFMSALANDCDYSLCFREQLKNYGQEGFVLVVYSGSGNSPNIVEAASYAKSIGMKVIGFTGRDGGKVNAYCDVNCIAPTGCMEEIEDVHMVWEHGLVCALKQVIAAE